MTQMTPKQYKKISCGMASQWVTAEKGANFCCTQPHGSNSQNAEWQKPQRSVVQDCIYIKLKSRQNWATVSEVRPVFPHQGRQAKHKSSYQDAGSLLSLHLVLISRMCSFRDNWLAQDFCFINFSVYMLCFKKELSNMPRSE